MPNREKAQNIASEDGMASNASWRRQAAKWERVPPVPHKVQALPFHIFRFMESCEYPFFRAVEFQRETQVIDLVKFVASLFAGGSRNEFAFGGGVGVVDQRDIDFDGLEVNHIREHPSTGNVAAQFIAREPTFNGNAVDADLDVVGEAIQEGDHLEAHDSIGLLRGLVDVLRNGMDLLLD